MNNKKAPHADAMPENTHTSPSQEHQIRVQKVTTLRERGIESWPATKPVNATCHDVISQFVDDAAQAITYQIAGRVVTLREHGKTAFLHIQDGSGKLQLYIKQEMVGPEQFEQFLHTIDIGDIIWVTGEPFKTQKGEITLKVAAWTLLSKCLHPLPEKFHGLADIETKYRQRYLDLISSPESRERFKKRSKIIQLMRQFFDAHNFIEVETPMLHPIPGGAAARPFVTHHNVLDADLYLRIAPELYLKRLVIGGFERVYEVNRNFRNEGVSTKHNPEFTMVEFYAAHVDYHYMMSFVEQMFKTIAHQVTGSSQVQYGNQVIDFGRPFERISMHDAVIKYGNCTAQDLAQGAIDATLKRHGITLEAKDAAWGHKLNALFEKLVEAKLIQPTFIIEFPIEISPLSKRNAGNPDIADRFELFIMGMEISNGFNELNDPFDQAARFKQQSDAREGGDAEAHHYDAEYITALEYGLPPTAGVGIGVDRLTMLMTDAHSIKDVILFPALKRKLVAD